MFASSIKVKSRYRRHERPRTAGCHRLVTPPPRSQATTGPVRFLFVYLLCACFLLVWTGCTDPTAPQEAETADTEFIRLMNRGKSHYENERYEQALAAFKKAAEARPNHQAAILNLANALLRAGKPTEALEAAQKVLRLDANSAAAHYITGCAHLRSQRFRDALKALQTSKKIQSGIPALDFQLGRAHAGLEHWDEAARHFRQTIEANPDHPAASYHLARVLQQLGQAKEAQALMAKHQKLQSGQGGLPSNPATFETCVHTEPKVEFEVAQPNADGIPVTFEDTTDQNLHAGTNQFHGPIGVLDVAHPNSNDLFVAQNSRQFRLLLNSNGVFRPHGPPHSVSTNGRYQKTLIGDLQNDRVEDAVVLGRDASHIFRFDTNGMSTEITAQTGIGNFPAIDGVLGDLNFTGNLDLVTVSADSKELKLFRNLGNLFFEEQTKQAGLASNSTPAQEVVADHWNEDDFLDLFIAHQAAAPTLRIKKRGGPFIATNAPTSWPAADTIVIGDLDNNLKPNTVLAAGDMIYCSFSGIDRQVTLPLNGFKVRQLKLLDYDNDGWLDLLAAGSGLKMWRNLGRNGFTEVTQALNLHKLELGEVDSVASADLDNDGDTDLVTSSPKKGLRFLTNQGGNANNQLKLQLVGNRSNASGLGTRIELTAGNWQTSRTVRQLPIEIGVGDHKIIDSIKVRWVDLALNTVQTKVNPTEKLAMVEISLQQGSCPYLYAWHGSRFRFVTDILSAAPLGLPSAPGRMIPADPKEYVHIGNETSFPPKDGYYTLEITEELREILYLDEAKLVAVDHPKATEAHSTSKMVPKPPFPEHKIRLYRHGPELAQATRSDGADVTQALREVDNDLASPVRLEPPQLRGRAKPHHITLKFENLPHGQPLSLVLTGWIRFGGGMANISAAQNPSLPYPFPKLEVQTANGNWQPVDVTVGTPAGKTKTITVDLTDKLPLDSRKLRLSTAFEIHWDRIALMRQASAADRQVTRLKPAEANLDFRGFSEMEKPAWNQPLTPIHAEVHPYPNWRIQPAGWATRYGSVNPLIESTDNRLAILAGGDALTLRFHPASLPPKPDGYTRDFFLYSTGWDKDADFHVTRGDTITPLPWHGMDYQAYGKQSRPRNLPSDWIKHYNTRWVSPLTHGLHTWIRTNLTHRATHHFSSP